MLGLAQRVVHTFSNLPNKRCVVIGDPEMPFILMLA